MKFCLIQRNLVVNLTKFIDKFFCGFDRNSIWILLSNSQRKFLSEGDGTFFIQQNLPCFSFISRNPLYSRAPMWSPLYLKTFSSLNKLVFSTKPRLVKAKQAYKELDSLWALKKCKKIQREFHNFSKQSSYIFFSCFSYSILITSS